MKKINHDDTVSHVYVLRWQIKNDNKCHQSGKKATSFSIIYTSLHIVGCCLV